MILAHTHPYRSWIPLPHIALLLSCQLSLEPSCLWVYLTATVRLQVRFPSFTKKKEMQITNKCRGKYSSLLLVKKKKAHENDNDKISQKTVNRDTNVGKALWFAHSHSPIVGRWSFPDSGKTALWKAFWEQVSQALKVFTDEHSSCSIVRTPSCLLTHKEMIS